MNPAQAPVDDARLFQLVLLNINDPETFQRYLAQAGPSIARYGGAPEAIVEPDQFMGEGLDRPHMANFVYYDSPEAFEAMHRDPEFVEASKLRTASIDMVSVEGQSIGGEGPSAPTEGRLYLIEVAKFGEGGADAYAEYERMANPVMARYGYHVERVLRVSSVSGFPFEPDIVKVAFFDSADGMKKMEQDPAHGDIEGGYAGVVEQSVWVIGHHAAVPEG